MNWTNLPWVIRIRWEGNLATKVYIYVDIGHATCFYREIFWVDTRRVSAMCTKLRIQDKAANKTSPTPN